MLNLLCPLAWDKAFNTISEGINSVPAGGLMIIRTGTTDETAVITKERQ